MVHVLCTKPIGSRTIIVTIGKRFVVKCKKFIVFDFIEVLYRYNRYDGGYRPGCRKGFLYFPEYRRIAYRRRRSGPVSA